MLRVVTPQGATVIALVNRSRWMGLDQMTQQEVGAAQPVKLLKAQQTGPTLEERRLWFSTLAPLTTTWGTYYTYRGDAQADPGLPLQPRYVASTFASSGPVHGVTLTEGTYTDTLGFNPVIALPLNPEATPGQEPALEVQGWAPSIFFGLQHLPGILGEGKDQALVVLWTWPVMWLWMTITGCTTDRML